MNYKTVLIQIGNSDDRLTQKLWSEYYSDVERLVDIYTEEVFFKGCALPNSQYQNAAFIVLLEEKDIDAFKKSLQNVRRKYFQNSIAIQIGETEFI